MPAALATHCRIKQKRRHLRRRTSGRTVYAYVGGNPISYVDPLGLWTSSVGGTVNFQIGFVNINFSTGYVIDGHGNFGTYYVAGGGAGVGARASAGVSAQGSTAETICDLRGPFTNLSVGAGAGVDASIDGFAGQSDHGPVVGGGFTLGAGLGAGGAGGGTFTWVNPVGRLW